MTLKEAIQRDGQRHQYVKSAITSGKTLYLFERNYSLKINSFFIYNYLSNIKNIKYNTLAHRSTADSFEIDIFYF